jgi:iron complex transport system substrate-binding protein
MRRLRDLAWATLVLLGLTTFAAHGTIAAAPAIEVSGAWTRPTAASVSVGVGYLTIRNLAATPDQFLGAASPVAAQTELHASSFEGGMARMRPVTTLPVPAGGTVRFEPNGLHLMLMGLRAPLKLGQRVPLTLRFEHAGVVAVMLQVGEAAPMARTRTGPARIVTLAPNLTELVYAAGAGDRIVGTVDTSDFPVAARSIPRIGDVTQLDAERLLALTPDLVLLWGDGSPAAQRDLLGHLGLPTLSLEQHRLGDVSGAIEQLGRLFGTEAVAASAAQTLRDQIEALRRRFQGARRLKVFYQVWSTPLYTLGGRHVATEMLGVCGADNVFASENVSAFVVDEEAVYARDPDVIALAGTATEAAEWLARWKARAPLRAIAAGAVIRLDPDLVNRMGPRIGAGTQVLCDALEAQRARLGNTLRR